MEDEMSGTYSMQGRREVDTKFCAGKIKEREHEEELGIDESIILKWILNNRVQD
jgi:hypothetical protein